MTNFIFYHNPVLTLVCLPAGTSALYSLETAAALTGVHPDLLRYYCATGLLGNGLTEPDHEPVFDDNAIYEARRIEHYRRHHGVNRRALPLIFELSREVERLQAELRFLRGP
jgi:DNA-binding transcriptional MerR regulator